MTGNLMTFRGRHKESIGYLERAISLDPLNSITYSHMSMPLNALGESAAAVNAARQAIKLSPDGMGHRYYLCLVLITQQRFASPRNRHPIKIHATLDKLCDLHFLRATVSRMKDVDTAAALREARRYD